MQKLAHEIYFFDEFRLHLTRGALFRGARELKLRPKSFDVLKYFAENSGRLISKDELIEAVWNETAVTDDSLVQCLKDIRHALGDDTQQIIKTVPRRGYIFEKEVTENGSAVYTEETSGVHLVIEESEDNGHAEVISGKPQLAIGGKSFVGTIKRHKLVTGLALTALALAGSGIAYGVFVFLNRPTGPPFKSVNIKQLTTDGKATNAVISPDGNYVAFVNTDNDQESLWVRQVAAVNPKQIAPPEKAGYGMMAFSPDSSFVYYVRSGVLYQVPVFGGTARKMLEGINSAITFSPDGKRFAFLRGGRGGDEQRLLLANADASGEEQTLAVRKSPEFFFQVFDSGPAWSPDGRSIVCPGGDGGGFGLAYPIEVSVADGSQRALTTKRWNAIVRLAWLADGSGLLMNAKDNGIDATRQIWHVSYPHGLPQRIYNDDDEYDTLSMSRDSGSLVSVQREMDSNIWAIDPQDGPNGAKQITFGTGREDAYWGMDTIPDGRIIIDSRIGGQRDLWSMDADGGNQTQLTFDPLMEAFVRVSPDGRQVLFHLGGKGLWTMHMDGSNRKQLTDDGMFPNYSPDGNWILYTLQREKWSLWKISSEGGESIRLTDHAAIQPAVSPDGKMIAYFTKSPGELKIVPSDGGEPLKVFEIANAAAGIKWTRDGKAITYKASINGLGQLVNQPLDGGQPQVLVTARSVSENIKRFVWSRDGKRLYYAAGPVINNVVMFSLNR